MAGFAAMLAQPLRTDVLVFGAGAGRETSGVGSVCSRIAKRLLMAVVLVVDFDLEDSWIV